MVKLKWIANLVDNNCPDDGRTLLTLQYHFLNISAKYELNVLFIYFLISKIWLIKALSVQASDVHWCTSEA